MALMLLGATMRKCTIRATAITQERVLIGVRYDHPIAP